MTTEKETIIYDVCAVPSGMTLDKIVHIWKDHELILYDSKNGKTPIKTTENIKGVLVDISTAGEEKLLQIEKLLKS